MIANQTLLQFLGNRGNVAIMASEENEDPVIVERDRKHGKYVVVFDPLDGSSNIDVNVSVGTIFSILRREPDPTGTRDVLADVLQPGYSPGRRRLRRLWQLDDARLFRRQRRPRLHARSVDRRVPDEPREHDDAAAAARSTRATRPTPRAFPPAYQQYLHHLRSGGAGPHLFVALHRLARGRLPPHAAQRRHLPLSAHRSRTPRASCGCSTKANPIAFLAEQAGGLATDGTRRILDIPPTSLHQRTPLVVGSREEMETLMEMLAGDVRG